MRWRSRRKVKPLPIELDRRSRSALALFDAGQYGPAERAWQALLADCEGELGPDHPETIRTCDRLGSARFRLRDFGRSIELHREALRRGVTTFGRNDPETLMFAHNLASSLMLIHHLGEAITILRDTLERRRRALGPAHQDTLITARTLGAALFTAGDAQGGLETLASAYELGRQALGPTHPTVLDIHHDLDIARRNTRWT